MVQNQTRFKDPYKNLKKALKCCTIKFYERNKNQNGILFLPENSESRFTFNRINKESTSSESSRP